MSKRSLTVGAVFGLLVSLALTTPSRAGSYVVQVSDAISITNTSIADTISEVVLTYSNSENSGPFNTMTNLGFVGSAVTLGPPTTLVTPSLSSNASAGTFTLDFSPGVFTIGGTINFTTLATTNDHAQLAADIRFVSYTIITATGTDLVTISNPTFTVVPEPASITLLGIGMAGFLSFRGFFKRKAIIRSKSSKLIDATR